MKTRAQSQSWQRAWLIWRPWHSKIRTKRLQYPSLGKIEDIEVKIKERFLQQSSRMFLFLRILLGKLENQPLEWLWLSLAAMMIGNRKCMIIYCFLEVKFF